MVNLLRCKDMFKQWPAWKRSVTLTKAMVDDKEECEVSTKLIKDLGPLIGTIRDRVDGVASTKVLQAIHRLMQLEENVERCSKRNEVDADRIFELEVQLTETEMDRDAYKRGAAIAENQLKTARRDAIHDAIKATMVKIEGGHAKIHKTSDLEAFADSQLG